uniref:Paladin n=1 Tax=Malurus cyaneus samueli TaxID=2593467 RepID=A0A8C5U6E4_9PASS
MGTTASAAQQAVSASPLESRAPGDGSMEDQHSLSIHSFQTLGLHNSKAKSIITNKVAPVVITYNCREEFQIHDDLLKANYTVGMPHTQDATLEHYLVQGKYFMVRDVYGKLDVLNTTGSCGAPNFRQAKGGYAVFGMGQPSLNGFKLVLQKLQREGHKECVFFCVREEPVVFLRLEEDFVSYTPRGKENLHENLQRGARAEGLRLAIRKEIRDFAQLSEGTYYVYNDIERLRDEPHAVRVQGDEDIHVTDEVYRRPVFLQPSYRSFHLSFFFFPSSLCIRFPLLCFQGSSTKEYFLQRTLQSLERYFYLIAFNYYLHEQFSKQYPLGFALSFSRWMCRHPELYRLSGGLSRAGLCSAGSPPQTRGWDGVSLFQVADERFCPDVLSTAKEMSVANFRRVPKMPVYGTAQPSSKSLGSVLQYLTDAKRKHSRILWINLREEAVLEGNEQIYSLREPGHLEELIPVPAASPQQLEKLEAALKGDLLKCQKWLEVYLEAEKQMKMFKSCLTTQEIFSQQRNSCQGLSYRRIPIPDFCAPREQDFDRLLEAMKSALAEDSRTAFVFNCSSGRGRTTTAMVIAVLTLWHFNGIPEMSEEEIVSVPDAKYTKGEFEVVMKVVQLLPDGHRMKKEVDMALDTVSETMTPMHYHLREIIICTYRQVRGHGRGQHQPGWGFIGDGEGTAPTGLGLLGLQLRGVTTVLTWKIGKGG